jgi:hypothetical protein
MHTGCGCIGHPAFPTPSVFLGEKFLNSSGASRREIAKSYLSLEHCHSGAMQGIEPGISRFRVWCWRTIPE